MTTATAIAIATGRIHAAGGPFRSARSHPAQYLICTADIV